MKLYVTDYGNKLLRLEAPCCEKAMEMTLREIVEHAKSVYAGDKAGLHCPFCETPYEVVEK